MSVPPSIEAVVWSSSTRRRHFHFQAVGHRSTNLQIKREAPIPGAFSLRKGMRKFNLKSKKGRREYARAYYKNNKKKLAKQQAANRRTKKVAKRIAAYNKKYNKKYSKKNYKKNRKRINERRAVRRAVTGPNMNTKHNALLRRHRWELVPRGIKGRPMSLEAHRKKLHFAGGRERRCWYFSGENNKTGSGLDRLDNNKTYTVANTVPCCTGCNHWRGHTHTVRETRNHVKPMRDAQPRN